MNKLLLVVAVLALATSVPAWAARPIESRDKATYVLTGRVQAIYARETPGYRQFIVELKVENVIKGEGVEPGDTFRAFCYKLREDVEPSETFDTMGHKIIPRIGQRVRIYVNNGRGHNEGVYPDWVDVLPPTRKVDGAKPRSGGRNP